MRIQSLLGPEYSTPERIHPGPWPASGRPQRPRRKRQAGGATTHGMNACPNMRARIHAVRTGIPRPQGPGELRSPWLGNESLRTRDHPPVHRWDYGTTSTGGSMCGSGRYVRSRSQTNTDEHRTSRTSVCRLAGINDRMRSGTAPPIAGTVFWRDARPSTFPIERAATPRCDWRNAE